MKNTLKIVSIILISLLTIITCDNKTKINNPNSIHLFAALGDAPRSNIFEVKIGGKKAFVEKVSKFDIPIHYVQLTYDESDKITIEITVDEPIKSYAISPISKGIEGKILGNTLSFSIDKASYLIVKINDLENLFFLIDKPQDYKAEVKKIPMVNIKEFDVDTTGNTIETQKIQAAIDKVSAMKGVLYFPKGIYRTGQLNFRSNMSIFVDEGALICGSINPADYADGALIRMDSISNFKLLGNGTIDGSGWAGLRRNGAKEYHLIYVSNSSNIEIDGTVLRDPTFWNTRVYRSSEVHLRNIKILNNRPYKNWTNTDGVDFDSSNNCSLINSVIHAGDDNLVVKGLDSERKFKTEHILFDNVLTMSNSAAAKIGTETCVETFNDIVFSNIDVVKCKRAMVINAFDSTHIQNVKFENFNIENFDMNGGEFARLLDFEITDKSWRECTGLSTIDSIEIKNVKTYCSMKRVVSQLLGRTMNYGIRGITIENMQFEGKTVKDSTSMHLTTNKFVKDLLIN